MIKPRVRVTDPHAKLIINLPGFQNPKGFSVQFISDKL